MTSLQLENLSAPRSTSPRQRAAPLGRSPVACLVLWLVVRLYQLALGCSGEGEDVELYRRYGTDLRSGSAASADFRPEYPPAALTLFVLPSLVGGEEGYSSAFTALMAAFDLIACLLVFHRARLRPRAPPRGPLLHAALYLVTTAALWPVLYARFDIVPAALVLAALHCLDRHRERLSGVLVGVAGAVKLWPFALAPLWIVWRSTPRPRLRELLGRSIMVGAAIAAGAILVSAPVLPQLGSRITSSANYHALRGIQIESTWSTMVLILDRLGVAEARVEEAFGSVQVGGRLPTLLVAWSLPATVILAMLPVLMVASRRRRSSGDSAPAGGRDPGEEDGSVLEHAALAVVLGCMIAAKVLSPQFVLWIAPLLALVARSPLDAVLVFMTAAMTTEIYPGLYDALMGQAPGHGRALFALGARNALLIGWYVEALRRLAKQGAPAHRLEVGAETLHGPILPLRQTGSQG